MKRSQMRDLCPCQTIDFKSSSIQISRNPAPVSPLRTNWHTFFDKCGEEIRNRQSRRDFGPHEWELEMLCNIGAAELLMPIARASPELRSESLSIATLMQLKEKIGSLT